MKGLISRLFFSTFFLMIMVGVIAESFASGELRTEPMAMKLSENADNTIGERR